MAKAIVTSGRMAPNSSMNQAVFPVLRGQWSENALDVEIVTGMQESAGPQAADFSLIHANTNEMDKTRTVKQVKPYTVGVPVPLL